MEAVSLFNTEIQTLLFQTVYDSIRFLSGRLDLLFFPLYVDAILNQTVPQWGGVDINVS
jgi:hypothetical protein